MLAMSPPINDNQPPPKHCSICRKPGGFSCPSILSYYSIEGLYAHGECLEQLKIKFRKDNREKYSM